MGIPRVILANGGIPVPVSSGGGPVRDIVGLRTVVGLPDRVVEALAGADPVEVEEVVGEAGGEGGGILDTDDEGDDGGNDVVVAATVVVCCLLRRRSRCHGFSFSALMDESCKRERTSRACNFIRGQRKVGRRGAKKKEEEEILKDANKFLAHQIHLIVLTLLCIVQITYHRGIETIETLSAIYRWL